MNNIVTCNVDDLSPPSRQHLKQLVARELAPHQKVYIIVGLRHPKPTAATKRNAATGIRRLLASAKPLKEVAAEEAARIVDEAMREVRHA